MSYRSADDIKEIWVLRTYLLMNYKKILKWTVYIDRIVSFIGRMQLILNKIFKQKSTFKFSLNLLMS